MLGALGFSAIGPVAGSVAAGWQASIGSVAAGSLFASLQSVAMGGAAMGILTGIGAGGAVAVAGAVVALFKNRVREFGEKVVAVVASVKERVREFAEKVVAVVAPFTEMIRGFAEKVKGWWSWFWKRKGD